MSCSAAYAGPWVEFLPVTDPGGIIPQANPSTCDVLHTTTHLPNRDAVSAPPDPPVRAPTAASVRIACARLPTGSPYRSAPVDLAGHQCSDGASDAFCTTAPAVPVCWCRSDLCRAAGSTASVHHSTLTGASARNQDPERCGPDGLQGAHRAHRNRCDERV